MKNDAFYDVLNQGVWDFVRALDINQLRELKFLQGTGWSKYMLTSAACTVTVLIHDGGISMAGTTDLNPTVRELEFYERKKDSNDDPEAVRDSLTGFLERLWAESLAHTRHTRLFGVSWPDRK